MTENFPVDLNQSLGLVSEREAFDHRGPRFPPQPFAQRGVFQQSRQPSGQIVNIIGFHQPSVLAMPDNFSNGLVAAGDGRFAGGHSFQVNAAERLLLTGQSEDCASPHCFGHFAAAAASDESHAVSNVQLSGERG